MPLHTSGTGATALQADQPVSTLHSETPTHTPSALGVVHERRPPSLSAKQVQLPVVGWQKRPGACSVSSQVKPLGQSSCLPHS